MPIIIYVHRARHRNLHESQSLAQLLGGQCTSPSLIRIRSVTATGYLRRIVVKIKTFRIKFKKVQEKIKFVKVHKCSNFKGMFDVSQSVQVFIWRPVNIGIILRPISSILSTRRRLQCTLTMFLTVAQANRLRFWCVWSRRSTSFFRTFLNFMNFILFQLKFIKFKSKIKFIKFELHNYAPPNRGDYVFTCICLSVCLSVCLLDYLSDCPVDYSKSCERILTKFFWRSGTWLKEQSVRFL